MKKLRHCHPIHRVIQNKPTSAQSNQAFIQEITITCVGESRKQRVTWQGEALKVPRTRRRSRRGGQV